VGGDEGAGPRGVDEGADEPGRRRAPPMMRDRCLTHAT